VTLCESAPRLLALPCPLSFFNFIHWCTRFQTWERVLMFNKRYMFSCNDISSNFHTMDDHNNLYVLFSHNQHSNLKCNKTTSTFCRAFCHPSPMAPTTVYRGICSTDAASTGPVAIIIHEVFQGRDIAFSFFFPTVAECEP